MQRRGFFRAVGTMLALPLVAKLAPSSLFTKWLNPAPDLVVRATTTAVAPLYRVAVTYRTSVDWALHTVEKSVADPLDLKIDLPDRACIEDVRIISNHSVIDPNNVSVSFNDAVPRAAPRPRPVTCWGKGTCDSCGTYCSVQLGSPASICQPCLDRV